MYHAAVELIQAQLNLNSARFSSNFDYIQDSFLLAPRSQHYGLFSFANPLRLLEEIIPKIAEGADIVKIYIGVFY